MEKTLFTIGYEGLSQKEFIATLAAAKVRIVFDVRELPLSRKPGFSKRGLADALGRSAIDYVHMPALGCPKPIRRRSKAGGSWAAYIKAFKIHLARQRPALTDLAHRANETSACLVCFEADFRRCHRTAVAEAAAGMTGLRIVHLAAGDALAPMQSAKT
jgi:uncharacterized protein (DUF488 family)